MISHLEIVRFKSLKEVQVALEPLTILVGANASGKTNLLDVIRFLQGVANGLTAREIMDGRPGDATLRRWDGIRGGSQEILYRSRDSQTHPGDVEEWMSRTGRDPWYFPGCLGIQAVFETTPPHLSPTEKPVSAIYTLVIDPTEATVVDERIMLDGAEIGLTDEWPCLKPRLPGYHAAGLDEREDAALLYCYNSLINVQFLDVSLAELRRYSRKGVKRLGDHGENFASVVHTILQEPERKQAYLSWLQELTPTRIEDVELFTTELEDVLFGLREDGIKLSAYSLSDGTLRFAALAAALLAPWPPAVLLVEEIENGVHPTRLRLVLELLSEAARLGPQIIVTTHSPLVLACLPPEQYKNVLFVYRSPDDGSTNVKPLPQVPHLMQVLERRPLDNLFATGWLEEAV